MLNELMECSTTTVFCAVWQTNRFAHGGGGGRRKKNTVIIIEQFYIRVNLCKHVQLSRHDFRFAFPITFTR